MEGTQFLEVCIPAFEDQLNSHQEWYIGEDKTYILIFLYYSDSSYANVGNNMSLECLRLLNETLDLKQDVVSGTWNNDQGC